MPQVWGGGLQLLSRFAAGAKSAWSEEILEQMFCNRWMVENGKRQSRRGSA